MENDHIIFQTIYFLGIDVIKKYVRNKFKSGIIPIKIFYISKSANIKDIKFITYKNDSFINYKEFNKYLETDTELLIYAIEYVIMENNSYVIPFKILINGEIKNCIIKIKGLN